MLTLSLSLLTSRRWQGGVPNASILYNGVAILYNGIPIRFN